MATRNRRREQRAPLLQKARPILGAGVRVAAGMALAGAVVLTVGLVARMDLDTLLRIERVEFTEDLRQVRPEEVESVLAGHRRGFFVINLDRVREELEAMPWVETVRLRRRWPDTIEVAITEPVPVARWGEDHLLDRQGGVFGPVDLADWDFLPALEGAAGRQLELMQRYLEVSARLADIGLAVSGVRESARRAWTIRLENGGEILMGRDSDLSRLEQLVPLMPVLRERSPKPLARVDLRYARGAAVAWQTASAGEDPEATTR